MQRAEIRAAGELVADLIGRVTTSVEGVHGAIARRTFRPIGPAAWPVRAVHDGVARLTYATVRGVSGVVARGAAAAGGAVAGSDDGPRLADSPAGSLVLGALDGAFGDALARQASPLALSMSLRKHGRDVSLDPSGVRDVVPDPSPRIAVFVHGLCETDGVWHPRRGDDGGEGFGTRLEQDLGFTALDCRYNSGLHVSENGRALSELLNALVGAWPVPVEQLVLVGHSMGGLVARSACHYGSLGGSRWLDVTSHVVCLGTPHLGAPLEKAVNVAGWMLARWPETRPLARLLATRSAGIKDLRFGSCVDEDWTDCDADALLRDRCNEVPFVPHVTYCFVAACVTGDARHPIGLAVGDLLVRASSAAGRGRQRRLPFADEHGRHLTGHHHFQLLHHPTVYDQLHTWLLDDRPLSADASR